MMMQELLVSITFIATGMVPLDAVRVRVVILQRVEYLTEQLPRILSPGGVQLQLSASFVQTIAQQRSCICQSLAVEVIT